MLNQSIIKCRIKDIKKYLGKQVKGTIKGTETILYFRLLCDEFDVMDCLDLINKYSNILLLDYIGNDFSPVYIGLTKEQVGSNCIIHITETQTVTEKFIAGIVATTPSGVTPMIKLPPTFTDLELLYKLNEIYPQVRFCGGNLFVIKGCNIGCCNIDLLKSKNVAYDIDAYYRKGACNCALTVHNFSEVKNITNIVDEEQKEEIAQKKQSTGKEITFADLLGDSFIKVGV